MRTIYVTFPASSHCVLMCNFIYHQLTQIILRNPSKRKQNPYCNAKISTQHAKTCNITSGITTTLHACTAASLIYWSRGLNEHNTNSQNGTLVTTFLFPAEHHMFSISRLPRHYHMIYHVNFCWIP